jgi:hypothetical protein
MVDGMRPPEHRAAELASTLFNQQLWCWGQDIKCDTGNLLVRYGFKRIPNAANPDSTSLYRLDTASGAQVILRGFGVFYGSKHAGGLFVQRYSFRPMLVSDSDAHTSIWTIDHIPALRWPMDDEVGCWWRLTLDLIDWIRDYESWVANEIGTAYRKQTLEPWARKKPLAASAESMASMWRWIGLRFAANPWGTVTKNKRLALTQPIVMRPEVWS